MKRLSPRFSKANRRTPMMTATVSGGVETSPTQFTFTDVTGSAIDTVNTSNTITIVGLGAGIVVPVNITAGGTYSKNAGGYTASDGTAVNGDQFSVRVTSSHNAATTVSAQLYVGGRGDTYSVTTA